MNRICFSVRLDLWEPKATLHSQSNVLLALFGKESRKYNQWKYSINAAATFMGVPGVDPIVEKTASTELVVTIVFTVTVFKF